MLASGKYLGARTGLVYLQGELLFSRPVGGVGGAQGRKVCLLETSSTTLTSRRERCL